MFADNAEFGHATESRRGRLFLHPFQELTELFALRFARKSGSPMKRSPIRVSIVTTFGTTVPTAKPRPCRCSPDVAVCGVEAGRARKGKEGQGRSWPRKRETRCTPYRRASWN